MAGKEKTMGGTGSTSTSGNPLVIIKYRYTEDDQDKESFSTTLSFKSLPRHLHRNHR
jgi:hypothetical protein